VEEIVLRDDVPVYHKFCVRSIKKGEAVIKYGEQLGLASRDIAPGDYVHTHNLVSQRGE
jgi:altronate dehydratase small subunit